MRFPALAGLKCPVEYRPAGYYHLPAVVGSESSRQAVLRYANLICEGNFSWCGYGPVSLGMPPQWQLDFVSGKDWPLLPSDSLNIVRHDGSDVRVPWELSRLQFLPVLGKAWVLTRDGRLRDSAKDLLSDWVAKNPVGFGVNWTVAMEAALRGVSICFLLELLSPFTPDEQPWLRLVTKSLWQHLLFIEAHNEFSHFARSNHYLSNIAGLFCLSTYLTGPGMEIRRGRYGQLVQREILHQVYDDGGDYEASTGYHAFITQLFTIVLLLMRVRGTNPAPAFLKRLRGMYSLMDVLKDSRGRLPHVGDCDDGRVELLTDDLQQMIDFKTNENNCLTVSSLLGIGGFLLDEDFGGRIEDAKWYQAIGPGRTVPPRAESRTTAVFPQTGIAAVRRGDAHLLFFAMPNGIAGKGSHTHNDKLSIVLRIGEEDFLTDSGTSCYSREAARRNFFRSTLAHNTVRIDKQEQNRISERGDMLFCMGDDAHVSTIQMEETAVFSRFTAEHNGYGRFGLVHRRTVGLEDGRRVTIEDAFTGTGTHSVEAPWHIPGPWYVEVVKDRGLEVRCLVRGSRSVEMVFVSTVELTLQTAPGVISQAYGATSGSTTVTIAGRSSLPFHLFTTITWGGKVQ